MRVVKLPSVLNGKGEPIMLNVCDGCDGIYAVGAKLTHETTEYHRKHCPE